MTPPTGPDPGFLRQLDRYVDRFREPFRRRDRLRWAAVYLQGLLGGAPRKNIEGIAGQVVLPAARPVAHVAQALQNFINHSPWDEQEVGRRYRALLAPRVVHPNGVVVVEDVEFLKQGRHSVGVQRQYGDTPGRKTNCQVAVALHYAGPAGYLPLALRLYLPQSWLRNLARLDAAGVPAEHRTPRTRARIALELLDQVRAEGLAVGQGAAGARTRTNPEFRQGLAERGLHYLEEVPPAVGEGSRQLRAELGLDHFEGRSWRGFHHHTCLVMLAYGFRIWSRGEAAS